MTGKCRCYVMNAIRNEAIDVTCYKFVNPIIRVYKRLPYVSLPLGLVVKVTSVFSLLRENLVEAISKG